jgi:hypothetical protein
LSYAIRLPETTGTMWLTDQLYQPSVSKSSRNLTPIPLNPPYYPACFLTIQNDIERAFIKASSKKSMPVTHLHRFPYPSVVTDLFTTIAGPFFPLVFMFCLLLSAKNIIKVSLYKIVMNFSL